MAPKRKASEMSATTASTKSTNSTTTSKVPAATPKSVVKTSKQIEKSKKTQSKQTKEDAITKIKQLESDIYASKTNINNIVPILAYITSAEDDMLVLSASQALRRVFLSLLKSYDFSLHSSHKILQTMTAPRLKFHEWVQTQAKKYIAAMLALIHDASEKDTSDGLQLAAIDSLVELAIYDAQEDAQHLSSLNGVNIFPQVCIPLSHSRFFFSFH